MSDEFYIEMYSVNKKKYKWNNHANDFPSFGKANDAITFVKADYQYETRFNSKNKIIYQIMKERDNGFGNIPTHLHVSNVECYRGKCRQFKFE